MAVEIDNLITAICAVDVTPTPFGFPPRFAGGRANAGFEPFAPTPAPPTNSERFAPGVYRLHALQEFNFGDGGATPTAAVNLPLATSVPAAIAFGLPVVPGVPGSDILVIIGSGGGSEPTLEDANFTLILWQLPVQSTG